jgi:predicted small secreted protein
MKSTNRTVLALVAALAAVTAACSAAPGAGETSTSESQDISSRTPTFVTIAAASRGYTVTPANGTGAAVHVASLDFSKSGFDAATIALVTGAPTGELVLEGTVSSSTFYVTAAYRGMPGITFPASATFYEASGTTAHALNETTTRTFASTDVTAAAGPFVQQSWLANETDNKGAIVAGHVTQGTRVLTVDQVFIALPYIGGPCIISGHVCNGGTVLAHTRDQNLCIEYAGCVTPTACPQYIPVCAAGYQLVSWSSEPGGCPAFACDPSFIH